MEKTKLKYFIQNQSNIINKNEDSRNISVLSDN